MGLSIIYFKGSQFPNYDAFLSLKIAFTLMNSVNHNEMLHHAAFHLGSHCLSKYLFKGLVNLQKHL